MGLSEKSGGVSSGVSWAKPLVGGVSTEVGGLFEDAKWTVKLPSTLRRPSSGEDAGGALELELDPQEATLEGELVLPCTSTVVPASSRSGGFCIPGPVSISEGKGCRRRSTVDVEVDVDGHRGILAEPPASI